MSTPASDRLAALLGEIDVEQGNERTARARIASYKEEYLRAWSEAEGVVLGETRAQASTASFVYRGQQGVVEQLYFSGPTPGIQLRLLKRDSTPGVRLVSLHPGQWERVP